jgi:hypothetical protein
LSAIDLESPKIEWSTKKLVISVSKDGVRDFSTKSAHDYCIDVSLVDFIGMLNAVSNAAMDDPEFFAKELESSLRSMIRLQQVAAGLVEGGK